MGGGGAPARELLHKLGYMGGVPQGSENARFERQYGPPARMHGCTDDHFAVSYGKRSFAEVRPLRVESQTKRDTAQGVQSD